jgi:hypothetical protein
MCRFSRQWLLWLRFQVDTDTPACHLVHHDLQHPPRPVRLCLTRRSQRSLFTHRHGPRHLIHHPDSAPPHIPASPRSAVQAWAVLHGRRLARMDRQPQLYRVDAVRVGHLLFSDGPARHEGHDELRRRHHRWHRHSSHVRDHALLSDVLLKFVLQDLVLYRVRDTLRIRTVPDLLFRSGRRHYHGPQANIGKKVTPAVGGDGEKGSVDSKDEGITVSQEIRS